MSNNNKNDDILMRPGTFLLPKLSIQGDICVIDFGDGYVGHIEPLPNGLRIICDPKDTDRPPFQIPNEVGIVASHSRLAVTLILRDPMPTDEAIEQSRIQRGLA